MAIKWNEILAIAAPLATLLVGMVLERLLERKPKLVAYVGHVSSFSLKGTAGVSRIHAHSIVVTNPGRRSVKNVRVGHGYLPDFELSPSIACSVEELPSGGSEIVFPAVVPGEQVTISYLYFPPITWDQIHTYLKHDDGLAAVIRVLPTRQYAPWVLRVLRVFFFIGVVATLYIGYLGIRAIF